MIDKAVNNLAKGASIFRRAEAGSDHKQVANLIEGRHNGKDHQYEIYYI